MKKNRVSTYDAKNSFKEQYAVQIEKVEDLAASKGYRFDILSSGADGSGIYLNLFQPGENKPDSDLDAKIFQILGMEEESATHKKYPVFVSYQNIIRPRYKLF